MGPVAFCNEGNGTAAISPDIISRKASPVRDPVHESMEKAKKLTGPQLSKPARYETEWVAGDSAFPIWLPKLVNNKLTRCFRSTE